MKITCKIEIGNSWNLQGFIQSFKDDANRIMPIAADKIRNTPIKLSFLPAVGMRLYLEDFNDKFKIESKEWDVINQLVGNEIIAIWIKPEGIILKISKR